MKHLNDYLECPYTKASRCGEHVGYCKQCKKYGRLTPQDRIGVAVIVASIFISLALVLSGCAGPETKELGKITGNYPVTLFKVDSCWYIGVPDHGLVHKANCPNPIHK